MCCRTAGGVLRACVATHVDFWQICPFWGVRSVIVGERWKCLGAPVKAPVTYGLLRNARSVWMVCAGKGASDCGVLGCAGKWLGAPVKAPVTAWGVVGAGECPPDQVFQHASMPNIGVLLAAASSPVVLLVLGRRSMHVVPAHFAPVVSYRL